MYIHAHLYLHVFVYYTEHGPPVCGYGENDTACEFKIQMPNGS